MSDLERTVNRLGNVVLVLTVAYLAFHVWLAYGLHESPAEFLAGLRLP